MKNSPSLAEERQSTVSQILRKIVNNILEPVTYCLVGDYDGCFDEVFRNDKGEWRIHEESNLFRYYLQRLLALPPHSRVYLFIGSARQYQSGDYYSATRNNNGSCFDFFPLFQVALQEALNQQERTDINVSFIPLVIEDIVLGKPCGTSVNHTKKTPFDERDKIPRAVFAPDDNKIVLLLQHIYYVFSFLPKTQKTVVEFVDDKYDVAPPKGRRQNILNTLQAVLPRITPILPAGFEVRLYCYVSYQSLMKDPECILDQCVGELQRKPFSWEGFSLLIRFLATENANTSLRNMIYGIPKGKFTIDLIRDFFALDELTDTALIACKNLKSPLNFEMIQTLMDVLRDALRNAEDDKGLVIEKWKSGKLLELIDDRHTNEGVKASVQSSQFSP